MLARDRWLQSSSSMGGQEGLCCPATDQGIVGLDGCIQVFDDHAVTPWR